MSRNVSLYPWFQFFRNLTFWQAIWFLYFQQELSASEAILLYAVLDIAVTVLEVPSGYLSDRVGRRLTLCLSAVASVAGMLLIVLGDSFAMFALAQVMLGIGGAFASGTDSALLYESLAAEDRAQEIERHEIRAWRASFIGLAVSAVLGGVLSGLNDVLPFLLTALTGSVALAIAFMFREPSHAKQARAGGNWMTDATAKRVLAWIFCLAVAMYIFNHVPFVFGQPFILEALSDAGLSAEAPLVSGAVTAAMMMVSVAVSWLAPGLRNRFGLVPVLLTAFTIQVGLIGALAFSNDMAAIALLLLRMVPNSLAKPFILARIQPLLNDGRRATYLSMQSFTGRLILAVTLVVFSFDASSEAPMPFAEIQSILIWYALAGLGVLIGLAVSRRMAR